MQILVNARFLTQPITGVQRYAIELVKAIDRLLGYGEVDASRFSFVLLAPRNVRHELGLKHMPVRHVGRLHGYLWEQLELPACARGGLLVNLCNVAPLCKRRQVVTIHDAAVFASPRTYPVAFRMSNRLLLRSLGKRAAMFLTDSHFSKAELIRYCGMDQAKVCVVHLGVDHILAVDPDESVLEKHTLLDKPFVLAVSTVAANKNFGAVVRAAGLLSDIDLDVAIVGGINPRVFRQSDRLLPVGAKYLGYVSDGELRALYEHAACFAYPSFYEGFGLPPLEAMACGCPVIVSNAASLPEVVGDGAILVDPYDVEALAEAIGKVLGDPALAREMRVKGLERAEQFTWEETARRTLKVYDDVYNDTRG